MVSGSMSNCPRFIMLKFVGRFPLIKQALMHLPSREYTLTGHFIRYNMLVMGWTPFCLQNCLNSSWHRFNKVLEAFLRDFGPY
ncbi:hypothetical protein GDO81_026873 [Engystomops pustulosus]|uniref:Uncharacterized protein n=1 Tax=Engystomops pustulosus TaxID=76066 RepID=A0AAV6YN55_ENGPU|nr:hypothetical protein GDO81_026873 [Engystomops pustulosus]